MFAFIAGVLATVASYLSIPLAVTLTLGSINAYLNRAFSRALAAQLGAPQTQWAANALARRHAGGKAEWTTSLADLQRGSSVLDLGSKGGLLPSIARQIGPSGRLDVVEPSAEALAASTRTKPALQGVNVNFHEYAINESMPLVSEAYDVVFAVEILQSVAPEMRQTVVNEWIRLVKPQGRLLVVSPGELDPVFQAGLLDRRYFGLSPLQCIKLLEQGGLVHVRWVLQNREDESQLSACVGTKRGALITTHSHDEEAPGPAPVDKGWESNIDEI